MVPNNITARVLVGVTHGRDGLTHAVERRRYERGYPIELFEACSNEALFQENVSEYDWPITCLQCLTRESLATSPAKP